MRKLFMVAALAASGCVTPLASYSPVSQVAGDIAYDKNQPMTISVREHSRVIVAAPSGAAANERPVFMLMVVNTSPEPVTIGAEVVAVRNTAGEVFAVIPPEQLEREARRRAAMIQFGAALQAVGNSMQAANAGYSNTYGSYSGNVSAYGAGGSAYGNYYGSYSGTQYNAAAAAQAQSAANAANAQIAQNAQAEASAVLANSQAGALQRQTIMPGQQFVTPVTIQRIPRNAGEVIMTVSVGSDVHEFRWNYSQH